MSDTVVIITLILTVVTIVSSGVWSVSAIKRNTDLLRQSIDFLRITVMDLRTEFKSLEKLSSNHERRLIVLEAQPSGPRNRSARP